MEVPIEGTNIKAEEQTWNKSMSKCRISAEWLFKEIKMQRTSLDFKRKMKIGKSPVGSFAVVLLSNCRKCCYPSTISQSFFVHSSFTRELR